jgi:hypothetical protein
MGGVTIPGIIKFLGAIFVGAGAAGLPTTVGWLLAVNLARVGALALIAKLTAPKLDLADFAVAMTITIRDPIAPQRFVYGEDLLSGPIIYAATDGDENRDLIMTVAHTGHEIDSVQRYRVDDRWINLTALSGAEDGDAIGGFYDGVLTIELSKGTSTQTVQTLLSTHSGALFTVAHTGRGWSFTSWKFSLVEGSEDVYQRQPTNLRTLIRGYKVYDPRLDTTQPGGSGSHRVNDPSTWEWSNNPALCLAHFLLDDKFGMEEESDRIDWSMVQDAADDCDASVTTPDGSQARYTCNVTFEATQARREVRNELVNAMLGRIVFSQGQWKMWAGRPVTSDVTLTEANLAGGISLQASAPMQERYNRLRGKYIDANKDYTATSYPEARSTTYVSQDGGEVLTEVADFMSCNNFFEAQRKSVFTLRLSRNQRVISFQGNLSCFRLQAGSVVTLDIDELGFASEKFFVTEWRLSTDGVELIMVEEDDSVWTDLLNGEYATRSATGVITFTDTGVAPPTGLTATAFFGGVDLAWTNPIQNTFDHIEIWRSLDNDRANAILLDTTAGNSYRDQKSDALKTRYYWIRAVDVLGRVSIFEPDLTTTTAFADPYVPQGDLVADPFIRQGATAWDVSDSNVQYRTGEGTGGTDAIGVQVTALDPFAVFYGAARRGPGTWDVLSPGTIAVTINFRIALRTKPGGTWSHTPIATVRVSDENPASNALTYISGSAGTNHLFTQADSINVWYDESVTLEITDSGTPPRYIQIGLWFITNAAEPEYKVDFLDAVMITPAFKGDNSTGLVPKYAGATSTDDFLRADGTWASPTGSGGGLPTGTVDGATLRYDFTAGEWQESTELRSNDTGNVTIGADTGGVLTITDSGGTSPITITPAGAGGTASLQIGLADSLSIGGSSIDYLDIANQATLRMVERSSAPGDLGGHGQFWVRSDAPNTPMFTADDGTDYVLNETITPGTVNDVTIRWSGSAWVQTGTASTNAVLIDSSNNVTIANSAPYLRINDSDSPSNEHDWRLRGAGGDLYISNYNDAGTLVENAIYIQNLGATGVGQITLSGDEIRLFPDNDILTNTSIHIFQQASASGDIANYGQLWVKNDTPNTLWFTNDVGTDIQLGAGVDSGTLTNAVLRWSGSAWDQAGTSTSNAVMVTSDNNLIVANSSPYIRINDSDSPANEHDWRIQGASGDLVISSYNDAGAHIEDAITIQNLGSSGVGTISLWGDTIRLFPDGDITTNTSIHIFQQAAASGDIANYGQFWVRDDTPNTPMFTDDAGTDFVLNQSTGVTTTGSPAADHVAVFASSNSIEGDADLTWNSSTGALTLGDPATSDFLELKSDAGLATLTTEAGSGIRLYQGTEILMTCAANAGVSLYYNNVAQLTTQAINTGTQTSGAHIEDGFGTPTDVGFNQMQWYSVSGSLGQTNVEWRRYSGQIMWHSSSTAHTWTTPTSTSTIVPGGWVTTLINTGSGAVTVAQGTGVTLTWLDGSVGGTTGNRTLSQGGIATLLRRTSGAYYIYGNGQLS